MVPLDGSIEAVYADGYVLSETELDDTSPYHENENVLRCILKKDPEAEHGKMVEFSVYWHDRQYIIDWRQLPENARPVRFKHMEMDTDGAQVLGMRMPRLDFGYQFTDEDGENVQNIMELEDA